MDARLMNIEDYKKKTYGFTIVELLIVIVVIAILAAISIVAYNGIQNRTENAKTVSAVSAWAKAMQVYKLDEGSYPAINSCLGASDTYTDSHNGRCYHTSGNGTWFVNSSFLTAMHDATGGTYPAPSNNDINANDGGNQYRGAMYYIPSGDLSEAEIRVSLFGVSTIGQCPSIGGLNAAIGATPRTNGSECRYKLPQ